MKGIILAGGKGTRLRPITKVINKSLLPVYDKPLIVYPIELFVKAGIVDIAIVAEPHYKKDFWKILRRGYKFGAKIEYISDSYNKKGPAQAVVNTKEFAGNENSALIFADNVFDMDVSKDVRRFKTGATIFVKEVDDPKSFGIVEINAKGHVIGIEEKPERPKSKLAVTGLSFYDSTLFEKISKIKPGLKGEYYITDVNRLYLKENRLTARVVKGFWMDAGTSFDNLLKCSNYWRNKKIN